MERKIKINWVYHHFKWKSYIVEWIAKHSETLEEYVVYRQLYWNNELYIRPLDMFLSEVDHEKYPDVKQTYRFETEEELSNEKEQEVLKNSEPIKEWNFDWTTKKDVAQLRDWCNLILDWEWKSHWFICCWVWDHFFDD